MWSSLSVVSGEKVENSNRECCSLPSTISLSSIMAPKKSDNSANGMKTISSFFKAKPSTSDPNSASAAAPSVSNLSKRSASTTEAVASTSANSTYSEPLAKKQKFSEAEILSREERTGKWKYSASTSASSQPQSQRNPAEQKRHDAFRKQLLGAISEVFSRGATREVTPEASTSDQSRAGESTSNGNGAEASGSGSGWQEGIVIDSEDEEDEGVGDKLSQFKSQRSAPTAKGKGKAKEKAPALTKGKGKGKASDAGIKYTPLEKQILDLKAKHPGVLLIVEVS